MSDNRLVTYTSTIPKEISWHGKNPIMYSKTVEFQWYFDPFVGMAKWMKVAGERMLAMGIEVNVAKSIIHKMAEDKKKKNKLKLSNGRRLLKMGRRRGKWFE